jgi:hypothetical protein
MNPNTGAIGWFESKKDADLAGHVLPLTEEEAAALLPMNRKARRKWAAEKRREQRREQRRARALVGEGK